MKIHHFVFLALLSTTSASAELATVANPEVQREHGTILSVGLGPGSNDLGVLASIMVRRDGLLFGVRAAGSVSLDFLGPEARDADGEIALLAGRQIRGRAGYFSVASGVAFVQSERAGTSRNDCPASFIGAILCGNEVVKHRTIGVPFEVKAVLSSRHAGIGLTAFGNVNPRASFAGLALVFELGELR